MKTLYIARHAKSSWDHPGLEDHQRPLMLKGEEKTRFVVDHLLKDDFHVDLILSSHAVRAHETAKIIARAIHYPEEKIVISENLYFGYPDSFFDYLL